MTSSWSKIRKILEENLLCECLKGRVTYFLTHYHGAPDNYGGFCVRVDGKEYVQANPYNEGFIFPLANQLQKELNIPNRSWEHGHYLYDDENRMVEEIAAKQAMIENRMQVGQVIQSIEEYRNLDIKQAICSENEVIRMFAVLDRRVGKRTLLKLIPQINNQPAWLQFFYRLRLTAEDLICT